MQSNSPDITSAYWNLASEKLLSQLSATEKGLTSSVAEQRLKQYGRNALEEHHEITALGLFINQFKVHSC